MSLFSDNTDTSASRRREVATPFKSCCSGGLR
jgi:hypothetical protein